MSKPGKAFPVVIMILTPAIVYAVLNARISWEIGSLCEWKEEFAAPDRPAYTHGCSCIGLKARERPTPGRGSDTTRCLGWVRRSWTDVDEIALKILEEKKSSVGKRSFERLNPSDQRLIEAQYRILQQAAFRKDFPRMLELSRKILLLVDDYGDTRAFEAVARKSLSPCAQKDGGCEL